MTEFLGNMYSWFTFIPKITLSNLFEILILTVLIYEVLLWVKSTRAGVLLRGGMIIVGFYLLAAMLHLNTITWIINHMGQLVLSSSRNSGKRWSSSEAKTSSQIFLFPRIPDSRRGIRKRP